MTRFTDLPLFASDAELGVAILGKDRAHLWAEIAPIYERRGMPGIDRRTGRRYAPAILAWFDHVYGLSPICPINPWRNEDDKSADYAHVTGNAVYFFEAEGLVKIGFSSDWKARLAKLQTASAIQLVVLFVMRGDKQNEQNLHRQFEHLHVRGEWFRKSADLLALIEERKRDL